MPVESLSFALAAIQLGLCAPAAWVIWESRGDLGPARVRTLALGWVALAVAALPLLAAAVGQEPGAGPPGRAVPIVALGLSVAAVATLGIGLRRLGVASAMRSVRGAAVPTGRPRGGLDATVAAALTAFAATLVWRAWAIVTGDPGAAIASVVGHVALAPMVAATLARVLAGARDEAITSDRRRRGSADAASRTTGVFSAVLAAASDAVALVSPDGRFRATNAAFDALVDGVAPGTATSEFPFAEPTTPERQAAWSARFAAVADGYAERIKRVITVGSEPRTFDIVISPAMVDGTSRGALVWCRDVTAAEALQDALAAREAYYRSLIEHSSDMILVLSPDGDLRYASPAAVRGLGLGPDEVLRLRIGDLAHPDDRPWLLAALASVRVVGDRRPPQALRLRRADGAHVELELAMSIFEDQGGQRSIIVNARDLTERRTLEQELLQAQRLDSLGRLAGGVAHDFNNLLTGLLAHVQFAQEEAADRPEALRELADVEATAKRAAAVTRQLLTFARRDRIAPTVFDANVRLRDLARLLERTVGERVRLEIALSAEPLPVRADAGQFEQAVLNLAVNARDAMPDGGTLTIRSERRAGPGSLDGRPAVVVAVSDTGTGMPEEVQRHIFEPFFTTKATGAGTGLGLASVYGTVTQAGGQIMVESRVGEGSRFELLYPLYTGALDESDDAREVAAAARADATILVVEDDPYVRRITARLLERRGYRVLEASDAEAALATWEGASGAVDVLLTDVLMPGLLGGALAARLRARAPALAVVYMTGHDVDAVRREPSMPAGPVIAKPFTEDDVLGAVWSALAGTVGAQTGRAK